MNRLERMRAQMQQEQLDAYVVLNPKNGRYLSNFTGGEATLLITLDRALLLTDFRYIEQAKEQSPDFQIVKTDHDHFASLAGLKLQLGRVGFEGDYITFIDYQKLQQALPQNELLSRTDLVETLRSVKDEAEIASVRKAVQIADQAFAEVLKTLEVGQTEEEIGLNLEFAMRRAGASGNSFDFIIASGIRGAMPHGTASSKKTVLGEFVTMDFGCIYQGYCSDITRTVFLGEPTEKDRKMYDLVLQAQLAGIKAVAPGKTGREVDAAARKVIADAGFGENFGHGLGHSVGLAIHEGPNFNTREERVIEPGMILTVEPGVYLPDWGGIRIEDCVLVTETGCEVLTQAPKDLILLK